MNVRDYKTYNVYDYVKNGLGELVKGNTPTTTIKAVVVEKMTELRTDNAHAEISNYFGLTPYKLLKVGMIIENGSDSYRIASVINSTRLSQLFLVKR